MSVQQRGYALIEALENQLKARRRLEAARFDHKTALLEREDTVWDSMETTDGHDAWFVPINSAHAQHRVNRGVWILTWAFDREVNPEALKGSSEVFIYESAYLDNAQWDADAADAAVEIARVSYDMAKEYMKGNG